MLGKLKWMVGLRLLLASALLGSAVALDLHERLPFPTRPLYGLLAVTFGLSLAYAIALRSQRWLPGQALAQLTLDLALVSLLVHFTGGLDSVFPFMYIFVIFAAATITERGGGLVVGILSGFLYAMLVLAEWTQVIRPVDFAGGFAPHRSMGYAAYQVVIHAVAFLAVAVLSSHLSYRLRQTGQELERRGLDLRNLQTLHQAIVSNISSGLMTLDLEGRVVSFNEAAERITGYSFDSLRDRPWQDSPFAGCPPMAEFFADTSVSLTNAVAEISLRRRDGRVIPVGFSCSPLRQITSTSRPPSTGWPSVPLVTVTALVPMTPFTRRVPAPTVVVPVYRHVKVRPSAYRFGLLMSMSTSHGHTLPFVFTVLLPFLTILIFMIRSYAREF